jgi:hypothetical protein
MLLPMRTTVSVKILTLNGFIFYLFFRMATDEVDEVTSLSKEYIVLVNNLTCFIFPEKDEFGDVIDEPPEEKKDEVIFDKLDEDDQYYKRWAGPIILGGFLPALLSLIIIFSGQLVLNTWTGTCGYALNCEFIISN